MEIDNRLYQPLIIISNNNNKTVKRKRYYSANKRDLKTSQCGHFQKPAFWDFNTHNKSNTNNVFMTNISLKEKEHNQFIMQDFSQTFLRPFSDRFQTFLRLFYNPDMQNPFKTL